VNAKSRSHSMAGRIVSSILPFGAEPSSRTGTVLLHLLAAVLYARHDSPPPDLIPSRTTLPSIPTDHHTTTLHPSTSETQLTDHIQEASTSSLYPPIRSIYITAPNPFPTLDQFVLDTAKGYNIDLHHFGGGMKAALKAYLGCEGGEGVSAMLMGTRRSDPNGGESSSLPASVLLAVRHTKLIFRRPNSSTNRP
jgi:hypothetical protein